MHEHSCEKGVVVKVLIIIPDVHLILHRCLPDFAITTMNFSEAISFLTRCSPEQRVSASGRRYGVKTAAAACWALVSARLSTSD